MLREVYEGSNLQIKKIKSFVEEEINKYIDLDVENWKRIRIHLVPYFNIILI